MSHYAVTLEVTWVIEADTPADAKEKALSVMEDHADEWPFVTAVPVTVEEVHSKAQVGESE